MPDSIGQSPDPSSLDTGKTTADKYVVLTPCAVGGLPLYFIYSSINSNLIGQVVKWSGTCYLVEEFVGVPKKVESYAPAIDSSSTYSTCKECNGLDQINGTIYQLSSCSTDDVKYFLYSAGVDPFKDLVSKVVSWDNKCWTVTISTNTSVQVESYSPNLGSTFDSCKACSGFEYYKLTACGSGNIIYSQNLNISDVSSLPSKAPYTGLILYFDNQCWTVEGMYITGALPPFTLIKTSSTTPYTCSDLQCQKAYTYWEFSNCSNPTVKVYVDSSVVLDSSKIYKILGSCYSVKKTVVYSSKTLYSWSGTEDSFSVCGDCVEATAWKLTDCDDPDTAIYVTYPVAQLTESTHLGRVIRVNSNGTEECYAVNKVSVPTSTNILTQFPGVIVNTFITCVECNTSTSVIPDFEELPSVFDVEVLNCCEFRVTNMTQLLAGHFYANAYDPELKILFPTGEQVLYADETISLDQATAIQGFSLITPSVSFRTNTQYILSDTAISPDVVTGDISQYENLPDGIYEVTFSFRVKDTLYTTTKKVMVVCGSERCLQGFLQEMSSCRCDVNPILRDKINQVRNLLSGARLDFNDNNYTEVSEKIEVLKWICSGNDCVNCGCGC